MSAQGLVSLWGRAPPERAFSAFVEAISAWWRPNTLFRFTPHSPGVLSFEQPDAAGRGGRRIETLLSGKVLEIGAVSA
jgi:hypothetical protein